MALDQGRTLAELRNEIQDLGYGTDTVAAQNRSINAAQRRISSLRRWRWDEDTDTLVLAASASSISIAAETGWAAIDALRLFDGTEELEWNYLDPDELRRRQWEYGPETGRPLWWTYYADEIRVLPAADKEYSITVDVVLAQVELSADGDRARIPARFSGAIVWGAIERLATRQRDWQQVIKAERNFGLEINAMITAGQVAQRQHATHVSRSRHWDDVGGGRLVWLS